MKVILVNGSPKEKGCTYTALKEVEKVLKERNIITEMFWIGNRPISGCLGCNRCLENGKCCINDKVNEFIEKVPETDGFVFGSPVYFSGISGQLKCFMDRAFYGRKSLFTNKIGTGVVACRRCGASSALEQINKYFEISNMPIISSNYWNMVFGRNSDEVLNDKEGMENLKNLGNNIAKILK